MSGSPRQASTHSRFQKVQECAADMEKLLFQDSKQSNSKADRAGGFTCHQAVVQPNDCTKLPNLLLED